MWPNHSTENAVLRVVSPPAIYIALDNNDPGIYFIIIGAFCYNYYYDYNFFSLARQYEVEGTRILKYKLFKLLLLLIYLSNALGTLNPEG